jgi:hypothetical protein
VAKGNVGNLLQHFVALRVAERVIVRWATPGVPVEYVDCFSMGPWEGLEPLGTKQRRMFVEKLGALADTPPGRDLIADAFQQAWHDRYGSGLPARIEDRDYPNTAVLLRVAFPGQSWVMRLHEIAEGKQKELRGWAGRQANGVYEVDGDWEKSKLLKGNPVPGDRPVLVMLDPYQIVPDEAAKADEGGKLRAGHLRYLLGSLLLNLGGPSLPGRTAPVALLLFSYSDQDPDRPHDVVTRTFGSPWAIERVQTVPLPDHGQKKVHQGWVVSHGLPVPVLGQS